MENKKNFGMAGILLAYPVAYIYLRLLICFPFTQDISKYGFIGATIFVILFIIYNEVVRKGRGKSSPKITYFWYGVMGLTALTVNIAPSYVLSIFAIHLCAVYGVLVSGNVLYEGKTGSYIVSDLLNGAFVKTFPNFGNIFSDIKEFRASKEEQKTGKSAKGILGGVILLLVMIPVFLIVIGLLGAVNYEYLVASGEHADVALSKLCNDYLSEVENPQVVVTVILRREGDIFAMQDRCFSIPRPHVEVNFAWGYDVNKVMRGDYSSTNAKIQFTVYNSENR